jgi:WD40 repeat protein
MHRSGKSIVVVSDDDVTNWNFLDGKRIRKWKNPDAPSRRVALDSSGRILAVGYDNGQVRLWKGDGDRELSRLEPKAEKTVTALAFSPDGRYLAVGSADNSVRIWELFGRKQ